ncbi:MAG: helix-turn-helix transcriptional regulator [Clostridia bacterium]|nr:helix-turn-helix transcriptional regulator [Clostridia bacterium]
MKLNERIYAMRIAKKMSQGDLAEALEVSRQSISKWETGTAVPEIDHLVRLSEIFGVTLDELVKGEDTEKETTAPEGAEATAKTAQTPIIVYREREPRKTAALILLICGILCIFSELLGAGGIGLLLAIPLFLCALICVLFRQRVGLWCGWTVLLLVDVYLSLSTTGVMNNWWSYLLWNLRGTGDDAFPVNIQLIVSILLTLWELGMIVATVFSYRTVRIRAEVKNLILVIGGWVAYIGVRIGVSALSQAMVSDLMEGRDTYSVSFAGIQALNTVHHVANIVGLTVLLIFTVALIHGYQDGRSSDAIK